jgi:hypothetical protein
VDEAPEEQAQPRRSLAHRFAPLILVAGVIAAAAIVIPRVPREREVELRFEDAATIVGVHLDWLASTGRAASAAARSAPPESEALQGTTWRFSAGAAPSFVTTTVRLPDGSYDLEILVERVGRTDAVRRSLTLGDADRIAVPVR